MDIAIIGGGPAGYSAALYAARFGRTVTVFEAETIGGQMSLAAEIENCFGFPKAISGVELSQRMREQAEQSGAQTVLSRVTEIKRIEASFQIAANEKIYTANAVIAATGADARQLGLPNEHALIGRGVSYCAACDANFYRGKTVAVVGGATSAVTQALHLSALCKQVLLLCRKPALRAAEAELKKLYATANITLLPETVVKELLAENNKLRGILCETKGQQRQLPIDGLFVSIGRVPKSELFRQLLETDAQGFLLADEQTATTVPGLFVAGDVRHKLVRQIATAVSDGVCAAFTAEAYLTKS